MMICSKCQDPKEPECFRSGSSKVCKSCDAAASRERRKRLGSTWQCKSKQGRSEERRRRAERAGKSYRTREELNTETVIRAEASALERAEKAAKREELRKDRPWLAGSTKAEQTRIRIRVDAAFREKIRASKRGRYQADEVYRAKEIERSRCRRAKRGSAWYMSWNIRLAFKGKWPKEPLEQTLGYSIDELRSHIETLFTLDMTWQQYLDGEVVIDHRRPVCLFDLKDPKQFRQCWALDNLQPLTSADNLMKAARVDLAAA